MRTKSQNSLIIALVSMCVALGPLTLSIYAPAMPAIAKDLGGDHFLVQLTLTFYLLGFALSQLVYGPISDRYGRVPTLKVGIAIYLISCIGCALSTNFYILIFFRFLQAMGVCAGPALGRAIVRDLYAGSRAAEALAFIGMAMAVAPAFGPLIGGYLNYLYDWEAIFVFLFVMGGILFFAIRYYLPETHHSERRKPISLKIVFHDYRHIILNKHVMLYVFASSFALAGMFTFFSTAPLILIENFGLNSKEYGYLALLPGIAYLGGSIFANRTSIHFGIHKMIMMGHIMVVLSSVIFFCATYFFDHHPLLFMAPMMLWSVGLSISLPSAMAGAMTPMPQIAGSVSALLGFTQMGLGAIGSWLTGSLLRFNPILVISLILLAIACVNISVYYCGSRRFRSETCI